MDSTGPDGASSAGQAHTDTLVDAEAEVSMESGLVTSGNGSLAASGSPGTTGNSDPVSRLQVREVASMSISVPVLLAPQSRDDYQTYDNELIVRKVIREAHDSRGQMLYTVRTADGCSTTVSLSLLTLHCSSRPSLPLSGHGVLPHVLMTSSPDLLRPSSEPAEWVHRSRSLPQRSLSTK